MTKGPYHPRLFVSGPYKRNDTTPFVWYYRKRKHIEIHLQADGISGLMHFKFNLTLRGL